MAIQPTADWFEQYTIIDRVAVNISYVILLGALPEKSNQYCAKQKSVSTDIANEINHMNPAIQTDKKVISESYEMHIPWFFDIP